LVIFNQYFTVPADGRAGLIEAPLAMSLRISRIGSQNMVSIVFYQNIPTTKFFRNWFNTKCQNVKYSSYYKNGTWQANAQYAIW